MNVPGELMTPSSQFWCLEVTQIFSVTNSGALIFVQLLFIPHVTSGHDLMLIPYEILGFLILGVFTPLDFKYSDAQNRETTHLDQRSDFL
jgi:hypothetical protein